VSWREVAPEPARLWIRWAPRRWPAPPHLALDLAARRLAWPALAPGARRALASAAPPARADLVYLPPVPPERAAEREALVGALGAAGVPVVAQSFPDAGAWETGAPIVALDLTPALLAPGRAGIEALHDLAARPRGPLTLWVVVPLLAGAPATGAEPEWLDALSRLRPDAVAAVAPGLAPTDRRALAELVGEERYEAIFHGDAPAGRDLARRWAAAGLPVFAGRPAAAAVSPRTARNRELAAALAEAGELWLGLGRPEPEGEALLAAARHLETTPLDLGALAREGNLGVVDWLAPAARRLVEEAARGGTPAELAALRSEWLAPEPGAAA